MCQQGVPGQRRLSQVTGCLQPHFVIAEPAASAAAPAGL